MRRFKVPCAECFEMIRSRAVSDAMYEPAATKSVTNNNRYGSVIIIGIKKNDGDSDFFDKTKERKIFI